MMCCKVKSSLCNVKLATAEGILALWQVYRSHQIIPLKISGFQLCKSTVYETEIKPLLGAELSKIPNQEMEFAVSFASVREFATLAA